MFKDHFKRIDLLSKYYTDIQKSKTVSDEDRLERLHEIQKEIYMLNMEVYNSVHFNHEYDFIRTMH